MILTIQLVTIALVLHNSAPNDDVFVSGPVIKKFGKIADVDSDIKMLPDMKFKVRFDVGRNNDLKTINQTFDSAARFINIQVASGVDQQNIELAVVVHGSSAIDVTKNEFYETKQGGPNPSAEAIKILQKYNVQFYVCGQSAAYHGIDKKNLIAGVKLAPSAMTIHAILDQRGFCLNPF